MKSILVTGANGFVGRELCAELKRRNYVVKSVVREGAQVSGCSMVYVMDIGPDTDWASAISGVDVVIHLAARVHVMHDKSSNPLNEFRRINVESAANLACQAAEKGVKRFVFLSSIKVNGESTSVGRSFSADDVPSPEDPYAISKYEAEQLLRQISAETGMEMVIIRPPLVYGPGVKANFESMMRLLSRRVPLPLAAVTNNRRSLVALDNLIDLVVTCLYHPVAANQTFLVSDGEDLSTADLLTRMGAALGYPTRQFYVPLELLKLGATMFNKLGIYNRLCGSLQLDITKTRQLLSWTPPVSVDDGLRRATKGFCQ